MNKNTFYPPSTFQPSSDSNTFQTPSGTNTLQPPSELGPLKRKTKSQKLLFVDTLIFGCLFSKEYTDK